MRRRWRTSPPLLARAPPEWRRRARRATHLRRRSYRPRQRGRGRVTDGPAANHAPFAPSVTASQAESCAWSDAKASGRPRSPSAREGPERQTRYGSRGRGSRSMSCGRHRGWRACRPRGRAERRAPFRPPNGGRRERRRRRAASGPAASRYRVHRRVFVVDEHPLAARVHHDSRHGRPPAGTAPDERAIHAFAREVVDDGVAKLVVADAGDQGRIQPQAPGCNSRRRRRPAAL